LFKTFKMNKIFSLPNKLIEFLKAVLLELKYIQWLSWKETMRLSMVVISTTIIMGILLALTDQLLITLVSKILTVLS
jgi:preprotein translocase SecE subunit